MTNQENDGFKIDEAKFREVALAVKYHFQNTISFQQIKDFILADWYEGQEHQDWLDSADADDIADWVIGCNPEF